jgi:hypothetical protein
MAKGAQSKKADCFFIEEPSGSAVVAQLSAKCRSWECIGVQPKNHNKSAEGSGLMEQSWLVPSKV